MVKHHCRIIGLKELDWRFQNIPRYTGLQHFSQGITELTTLNAKEYRQIAKVILLIVSDLLPDLAPVTTFYHFLQWWYLIAKTSHSDETIMEAKLQLAAFAKHVQVFKQYSRSSFNVPKFHSMTHYTSFITSRGSLDNFTTEHFEHQHILDAKIPFKCSNKRDPIIQILSWISQHDIVIQKREYLQHCDAENAYKVNEENMDHHRLGSPRQPEGFLNIDDIE